ncbi:MAG: 3'-5' exonuclease [Bacteriovoracaceae bacterium]|nr:3'-5' exonuclease [Bacteriovoracaceae bacterium]
MKNTCIVLDFETTGLSPGADRAIEVAAVLLENGKVKDRFQSLMNPGKKISPFIESYTGITNSMLASAPKNEMAIRELVSFIGKLPLVAHNASFDKRFLDYEVQKAGRNPIETMACSLLVSRRIYDQTPNHKLQTLVEYKNIQVVGNFHRALADAEMTAHLWVKMKEDIEKKYKLDEVTFDFMFRFGKTGKKGLEKFVQAYFCQKGT